VWSTRLQSLYKGTSGSGAANCTATRALNYDNHPGYDYLVLEGKSVNPAAAGDIIFEKCIFTFTNSESCDAYGAVAVDHGNGFVTQYLHMANLNYGNANNGMNQPVTRTWVLGTVSDTHVTGHPHLHFEVLRRKSVTVDKNNYYARANYMIVDPYGYKTGSYYADRLQSRPGCLWVKVCLY
jgi:murein DD-endopeptidase MepM/ murein hydrolase activator NlpD